MIATSPGRNRLTRCFVRFPSRAIPATSRAGALGVDAAFDEGMTATMAPNSTGPFGWACDLGRAFVIPPALLVRRGAPCSLARASRELGLALLPVSGRRRGALARDKARTADQHGPDPAQPPQGSERALKAAGLSAEPQAWRSAGRAMSSARGSRGSHRRGAEPPHPKTGLSRGSIARPGVPPAAAPQTRTIRPPSKALSHAAEPLCRSPPPPASAPAPPQRRLCAGA